MRVILDRFESVFAVVEMPSGVMINIPKELLDGAKPGDIIDIITRHRETENKKLAIQDKFDHLKNSF